MEQPSIQDLSAPTGEFLEPPPSEHPILSSGYELCPDLIAMVQEFSFSGLNGENPYHHLQEFEQMCSCYAFAGMTHDTFRWKLFPLFSYRGGETMVHKECAECEWELE